MYFHRTIEKRLLASLQQFPVALVTGARQVGKSTLLAHALKDYRYISLDDLVARKMAQDDPALFLDNYKPPLIIDEIQYAPELLSYIKMTVDVDRHNTGQFVLTGSQTFELMQGVTETLAGRIAIFQLYPFSWQEIPQDKQVPVVDQAIQGFYPEFMVTKDLDWNLWFGSYLTTYLERDVRNILSVVDLGKFQTFLNLLAARAGKILNIAEVAQLTGISQPTAKSWLTILEATYIIYLLKPYQANLSKRFVKSPKIYFVDTGMLCYLLGIDVRERFLRSAEVGHIFENMVIMEAVKCYAYQAQRTEFYYYRDSNKLEIDLLIDSPEGLSAYEIKFAKTIDPKMTKPMELIAKSLPFEKKVLLSLYPEVLTLKEGIQAKPWYKIGE